MRKTNQTDKITIRKEDAYTVLVIDRTDGSLDDINIASVINSITDTEIELITEKYDNELEFIHLTYTDCIDSILDFGFYANEGNMGFGVYAADYNDSNSIRQLRFFSKASLFSGEEKAIVVKGKYSGPYLKCIKTTSKYSDYNIGFILIEEPSKISDLTYTEVSVDELPKHLSKLEHNAVMRKFQIKI